MKGQKLSSPSIAHPPESDADLEFYGVRDDFVRAYQPATAEERFLVIQISQSWIHLQEMYQLRRHLVAKQGLAGFVEEDYEKYKTIMRHLLDAERMWYHATAEFKHARRRISRPPLSWRATFEDAPLPPAQPEPTPEPAAEPAPPANQPETVIPLDQPGTSASKREHVAATPIRPAVPVKFTKLPLQSTVKLE